MKTISSLLLLAYPVWAAAQVSPWGQSTIGLHPRHPGQGPFIIEVSGTWPNDCHPGEQRPFISDYDGASVSIEFEIVVIHVTCNDTPTRYRVLVDMSDVVGTVAGEFFSLEVQLVFSDSAFTQSLPLLCGGGVPCDEPPAINPDTGLYQGSGLANQGLLLVRQREAVVAYPLVYDENGDSEWLFAGGLKGRNTYFKDLFEFSGGPCLGCPSPAEPPDMKKVGHVTMLFDAPHRVQVRFNDLTFVEYQALSFGYGTVADDQGQEGLVDLSGRWGVSEIGAEGGAEGTHFPDDLLPFVFDIGLDHQEPGEAAYVVSGLGGQAAARLDCSVPAEVPCILSVAGESDGIGPYPVEIRSFRRIRLLGGSAAPGLWAEAVRID